MKTYLFRLVLLLFGFTAFTAKSAIVFDLQFVDVINDTNANWDDPMYGSEVRARLQTSLNHFGLVFADNRTITLEIMSSQSSSYYAMGTSSMYTMNPTKPYWDASVLTKIQTGVDVSGSFPDGSIEYSFNYALYPDLDGNGVKDVRDVAFSIGLTRHELMHVLGMDSFLYVGAPSTERFNRYDAFLCDSQGRPFVLANGSLSGVANMNDSRSYFDTMNSGPGSNLEIMGFKDFSHLKGVMEYRTEINDMDKTVLATLGYNLVPNPEPSSALMVVVGAGLLGSRRLRRRAPIFFA